MKTIRNICAAATLLLASMAAANADTAAQRNGLFALTGGEALYQGICQGCHMADARGAAGAAVYPPLARNPKLESAGYVIGMVLKGRGGMPPVGNNLSDAQIADVVNYVRGHFGNRARDKVSEADVKALR